MRGLALLAFLAAAPAVHAQGTTSAIRGTISYDTGPRFANSIVATRAQRQFMQDLHGEFPGYSANVWGLTASDSAKGYVAWGGPPRDPAIDGSVVPCAPGGSLMFTPDISVPAL